MHCNVKTLNIINAQNIKIKTSMTTLLKLKCNTQQIKLNNIYRNKMKSYVRLLSSTMLICRDMFTVLEVN